MRGLVIWAQIKCRSVMELYRQMSVELKVPLLVPIWHEKPLGADIRKDVGFKNDEFADIPFVVVGDDFDKGVRLIEEYKEWRHIFCVYQNASVFRRLIIEAKRRTGAVGVMSEAPCNMNNGVKGILKECYLRFFLKKRLHEVTANADFFVNYSGNDEQYLSSIGWPSDKVIPFGYFPPPIPGSGFSERKINRTFSILSSGVMTWHRGVDVLVEALHLLTKRGVPYHATITQCGPLFDAVKNKVVKYALPVDFPGFVPIERLIELYCTCSVYVGAGRHEPWGMRLNDALNCGAPLVVSRGMGGVKLVDDYGCGIAFSSGDSRSLADALQRLIVDRKCYAGVLERTAVAAAAIKPQRQAKLLIKQICAQIPGWFND